MQLAQRLQQLPAYVFAELAARVEALRREGQDVIRLDIGSPDLPPSPEVIAALEAAARRPTTHGYADYYGLPAYRQAIAEFYARRFGVELDPRTETLALIGSKEGLYHVPTAFIDPGAVALTPDPGYPTYSAATRLVGGEVYPLPLQREHGFLPDLDAIPAAVLTRARVLWLNYPHNPTAAVADLAFLEHAVAFARRQQLLLVYDHAYSEIAWDGITPPSVLQIPGAKEVAVEFNSLSKTFNMAGWRIGMAVGNADAIAALARVKTNADTGIFLPIQEAAVTALHLPTSWYDDLKATYRRRREIVTRALERMNIWFTPSAATFYVWLEVPPPFASSAAFASALLEATGVSLTPGAAFGAHGEGYARITLVQEEARLTEAMERWERWLIGQSLHTEIA
ncbi:MAG TPA: aminotransferase class I/II-fold pyridoxal phosphate-dependent enzyme [Anaerolineae bacterium]|nr:aminotransferase class I/II-fold pyridoxal phosphate-dependent enzyme [Anaerolineae bacterium]